MCLSKVWISRLVSELSRIMAYSTLGLGKDAIQGEVGNFKRGGGVNRFLCP